MPTGEPHSSRFRTALDVSATVAMLIAAVAVAWTAWHHPVSVRADRAAPTLPAEPVALSNSPRLGKTSASVVIVEFADFQCPYCARFSTDVLPSLKARYIDRGLLQLVFKHLPLAIHPRAEAAAEMAACAAREGHFWELHDVLFQHPDELSDSNLQQAAHQAGVTTSTAGICNDAASDVQGDMALAGLLGLAATPAFLFGTLEGSDTVKVTSIVVGA